MPEEEELTLGGGVNFLSVMHTLKAGKVRQFLRDHGAQLVGDPLLVTARIGAHYLKAMGGLVGGAGNGGREEGQVSSRRVHGKLV
jgi:hypothetical protein